MQDVFNSVNSLFEFIVPIADFMWEFPTNFEWYANIPILGEFAFAVLLLLGVGIYFTFKTGFVQCRKFRVGMQILTRKKSVDAGVSPLAAFLLSSAMRVGPGNIMGVTGAISVGGPGAVFWMWVSAFFGMSMAFAEAVLAQLFKEKSEDSFVGGIAFYGRKILGDRYWVGVALSVLFIMYALFCIPAQTFHMFTSLGFVAESVFNQPFDRQSMVYYIIGAVIMISVVLTIFGGIRRVTQVTDKLVPIMAIIYTLIIMVLILLNLDLVPYFFKEVFTGAFKPDALFGGAFGVALSQGIKRGLMSNEAGQGTITMAAAISDTEHPCEQGFIQAIGVFLDTMVICTMTAFVIVMASLWNGQADVAWETVRSSQLDIFLASLAHLVPGTALDTIVGIVFSLCYALFAFTTLLGMILFAEISANSITKDKRFIKAIRGIGVLIFVPFGILSVLAGLELGNIWYISDLVNILVVFANVPLLIVGRKLILKTLDHYENSNGKKFRSEDIGIKTSFWK